MDPAIECLLPDLHAAECEVIAAHRALRRDAPRHHRAAAEYMIHVGHVADACLWSARKAESMIWRVKGAYLLAGLGIGFGLACLLLS